MGETPLPEGVAVEVPSFENLNEKEQSVVEIADAIRLIEDALRGKLDIGTADKVNALLDVMLVELGQLLETGEKSPALIAALKKQRNLRLLLTTLESK